MPRLESRSQLSSHHDPGQAMLTFHIVIRELSFCGSLSTSRRAEMKSFQLCRHCTPLRQNQQSGIGFSDVLLALVHAIFLLFIRYPSMVALLECDLLQFPLPLLICLVLSAVTQSVQRQPCRMMRHFSDLSRSGPYPPVSPRRLPSFPW